MSFLRIIGPASIEVWISSPVRSRKPVLMNTMRFEARWMQALRLTVVRRSSSMMPTLMVFSGSAEHLLDPAEQLAGQRDLVGAVHLRLDDVDRAGAAVLRLRTALEIMDREQAGDRGVEEAFRNLLALRVEHRVGEHVVADIAHQQQAAAVQLELLAIGRLVDAVGIERAGQRLAALLEVGRQRAVHQAERVAIDQHLVFGIDRRDAVFHVEDGARPPIPGSCRRRRPDRPCRSRGCGRS